MLQLKAHQWISKKANNWYVKQLLLVGANFFQALPSMNSKCGMPKILTLLPLTVS